MKRVPFQFPWLLLLGCLLLARTTPAADPTQPTTGRWTSFGNGPAHSGFYPATIGAATPVPGWTKSYSPTALNQVVISDGRVFVSSNGTNDYIYPYPQPNPFILALDETTGAELWRVPGFYMTHMTVGDTHLYSAGFETNLLALRVADGTTEWMRDNYDYSGPPAVVGDRLSASATSGVAQFRISDNTPQIGGTLNFAGYDCRHSVSEGTFYISDPQTFIATDMASGARLWSIPTSQDGYGSYDNDIPAVAGGRAAFAADASRRVVTVDLKTKKVLWSILGTYPNYYFYPVVNDGSAVYVVLNRGINAYAAATGELLGRYDFARETQSDSKQDPLTGSQPIITNDAVIVASAVTTFIFDKATFQLRTELPTGGYLSYARGVLYVAESSGKLSTFHFPDATESPPPPWPAPTPVEPEPKSKIELVTFNAQGTGSANNGSYLRAVSRANNRFVVFISLATNLTSTPDTNGTWDFFVRDLQTNTTEMVTVNAAGTESGHALGQVHIQDANTCITPDGHFVAFDSPLVDLDPADTNGAVMDVFVRDLQTHKTSVVSVAPNGSAVGGLRPFLSADGRYVVFDSLSNQLVPGNVPSGTTGVFVRDRQAGLTTRVSVDNSGAPITNATAKAFSKDGRYVVFKAPLQTTSGTRDQLFRRDLQLQTTQLLTSSVSAQPAAGSVGTVRISEDARFVVFDSTIADLVGFDPNATGGDIFVCDTVTGSTTLINYQDFANARLLDMSADGMVIGFYSGLSNTPLYICDRRTGVTSQLVYSINATDIQGTTGLRIDRSGRFVLYNAYGDVRLFDLQLKTTRLISHNVSETGGGNGGTAIGDMSDDGQIVFLNSLASNLVILPDNNTQSFQVPDVFVARTQTLGTLLNISTRGDVRGDDNTLIGGFVVSGTAPKKVILRALGPSLQAFGISNAVSDPVLSLYDHSGALLAGNDNWKTNQTDIEATGIPPSHDLESAIVRSLDPGAYTVVVRGNGAVSGAGLIELYDLDSSGGARLANISTRGFVGAGDNAMIAGFIAGGGGGGGAQVLVRGLGPTLSSFGVAGTLQDPLLELRDPNGTLAGSNDDWRATQGAEIEATGLPPTNATEAAILAKLAPGPYTAIVRGKGDSTGVALVEVYNLN